MSGFIETDLGFTVKGASQEQADAICAALNDIVIYLYREEDFDLRGMHRIIVTADYAGELAELSGSTPSGNPIEYTDDEHLQGGRQPASSLAIC